MYAADRLAEDLLCRTVLHRETIRHSHATRDLAYALATRCGYTGATASAIARAALLHDIGKGVIPVALLDAPRPLTVDELLIFREHARSGARIAREGGIDPEICTWIANHHERPDGSGYEGLKGDQISPEARVVIVADVWEATGALRPYSRYLTRAERWNILVELGCGREVRAMRALLEESVLANVG